ncbi:hypothetical protein ACUV84_031388 [Puccinellia chinampoensis]
MASERKSSVVVWGVLLVAVLLATVAAADWDWLDGRCLSWCESTKTDPDELEECKQLCDYCWNGKCKGRGPPGGTEYYCLMECSGWPGNLQADDLAGAGGVRTGSSEMAAAAEAEA